MEDVNVTSTPKTHTKATLGTLYLWNIFAWFGQFVLGQGFEHAMKTLYLWATSETFNMWHRE